MVPIPLDPSSRSLSSRKHEGKTPANASSGGRILSRFLFDFVPVRFYVSKGAKALRLQGFRRAQEHKMELGDDYSGYLSHSIRVKPSEIKNQFGLEVVST